LTHPGRPATVNEVHRTLIVANRTAATPVLMQEIERRAGEQPTQFVLLIPDVTSRRAADWTREEALRSLRQAARGPNDVLEPHVEGILGGKDPFESVKAALGSRHYDDVIISTLPKVSSDWLRRKLPSRVEGLGVPVTVITPEPENHSIFAGNTKPPAMGGGY
jgi:hypothetical protein